MIGEWQASIANAEMAELATVAGYLLAALFSTRAAGHARLRRETRERAFWQFTTVLLVFLGINELLDLQSLLTAGTRAYAKAYDWYGQRRTAQHLFVLALAVAALVLGAAMLWFTRRTHAAVRLGLVGLAIIGLFVLLRAASIHHVDELLGRGSIGFNWWSIQEMTGILVVAAAAFLYARKRRKGR